ncbi:hypothetical protein GCM10022270_03950 [Terriglobus aquaticus]
MLLGQSQNGSIAGVITDQGGAVVAGATITITNVNTGAVRTTTTDRAGTYNVQGLLPQDYRVSVTAPGFAASEAKLNVSVGSSNTINVKLAVGQQSVTVDVAANALAGINLENAEQSQVVDTQQLLELPTETRNPYDFVQLSGSVSADPSASSRGVGVNVNGARSASTEILLDGIENTALFGVSVATIVPVDSVQEYRVITNNFGPEYGRASGGVVNVVTKGGTNQFHGTAYEFYRPSTFASNSYYNNANGISQHRFVRNNFGYSVGGPIIKDKLFFFNNTEWLRVRSSNVVQFYVPTSQFINASNANTQAFFQKFGKISGTPTGKILTLGQIGQDPKVVSSAVTNAFSQDRTSLESRFPGVFTDAFPILQQVNVTVPIDAGGGSPQNTYNIDGRLDFNLGTKTQMYGRYVLYNAAYFSGSVNNSPYAGYNTSETTKAQNLVYGLTHTFTDRFTSQLQIGLLRYNDNQPLGDNPAGPTLFINSSSAPSVAGNQFVFPGYNEKSAGNGLPSGGPQNNIVISPVFTLLHGRHTITFGGQYDYIRDNHTFAIYANAQEALLQNGTNGALVNFQSGVFNFFQANLDPQGKFPCVKDLNTGLVNQTPGCTITTPISQPSFARSNRYHEGAGFVNDTIKATPRLTLNVGLRYELYGTQHNKNSALDSNFYFGTSGTLQDRIRAGKVLNVNAGAPADVQNPGGKLWNTNYKQFAPRVSFAYDLFGDGKTSLRGGYGMSYERNFGNVTYNVALNPPAQLAISFTNVDVGAQIPISTGVLGSFSGGSGVSKAIPPGTVRAVDPRIKPAYSQFFSLSVEHQLKGNITAGLAYNGSRGIHNYSIANYNRSYYGRVYEGDAAKYTTGAANSNRLNPQYTSINVRGADGDSYYHSLNASLRASNMLNTGLSLTSNYTYSHSTDNTSSTFTDGASGTVNSVAYFDPFNHALDHGNSDFDQTHRITVGLVYQVPFAGSALTKRVLGGWEVGSTFAAQTGTPFSVYDCGQNVVTVCPRARFATKPSFKRTGNSVPVANSPDVFQYITFPTYNKANYPVYNDPTVGYSDLPTIVGGYDNFPGGMTARNAFRGPGNFTFNADVNKRILITERVSFQLRAELYNVLNHANSFVPASFGSIDVSSTPYFPVQKNGFGPGGNRQLQLAGKLIF